MLTSGQVDQGETNPRKPSLALIAIRPGDLQDSLVALMTTMPQVNAVLIAEDAAAARRTMAHHRPSLVVIEAGLPADQGYDATKEILTECTWARCIVLADDVEQQRAAESAGADVALIVGFQATRFTAAVEEVLAREKEEESKGNASD
jgi:DNA-binding NarL/FixJ family response regulator